MPPRSSEGAGPRRSPANSPSSTRRSGAAPLATLAETFTEEGAPKGEVVVVIGTNPEEPPEEEVEAGLDAAIEAALSRHSIKDAAALVADATGQPRRVVYARALVLARRTDADV